MPAPRRYTSTAARSGQACRHRAFIAPGRGARYLVGRRAPRRDRPTMDLCPTRAARQPGTMRRSAAKSPDQRVHARMGPQYIERAVNDERKKESVILALLLLQHLKHAKNGVKL